MPTFSFTRALVGGSQAKYEAATKSPFLRAAAEGRLPKDPLARWLANDRLYIHSYIKGAGKFLSSLDLPVTASTLPSSPVSDAAETKVLDWLIESLVSIRREEAFFLGVASKYKLPITLATENGQIREDAKLEGLTRFEAVFGSVSVPRGRILPWLEGAIIFWGTEKCYLDAWTWAKSQLNDQDAGEDADGGALRTEFIPNWSSDEFAAFVDRLGGIIDDAVLAAIEVYGESVKDELLKRVESKWLELLEAEASFWPPVE